MKLAIATREPFSFDHTLAFLARFPPARLATHVDLERQRVTLALAHDRRAYAVTVARAGGGLVAELADATPIAIARALVARTADVLGAGDDVDALYAAARTDPPFRALVDQLFGLHHVRFVGGLDEAAVYCVMMQRTPIGRAVALEQRFLARFGHPVALGDRTLHAMPAVADVAALAGDDIADAIGNRPKGERIAVVARGVAALGEAFLRTAPYGDARDALLAIPGIGPFSAAAILLRGLGRMDEVPSLEMFEREGRAVYGPAWHPEAIARRYGTAIGYWSFYVKSGARA